MKRGIAIGIAAAVGLSGCAVGPNRPDNPELAPTPAATAMVPGCSVRMADGTAINPATLPDTIGVHAQITVQDPHGDEKPTDGHIYLDQGYDGRRPTIGVEQDVLGTRTYRAVITLGQLTIQVSEACHTGEGENLPQKDNPAGFYTDYTLYGLPIAGESAPPTVVASLHAAR